jgi:hypothetical protein
LPNTSSFAETAVTLLQGSGISIDTYTVSGQLTSSFLQSPLSSLSAWSQTGTWSTASGAAN